jgi:type I restriction enzyme, S subunit
LRPTPLSDICDIEMGQAPVGSSYNRDGEGYPLLAGAGDFGVDSPIATKYTTRPTKISQPKDILLCIRATVGDLNWSDKAYCLGRGVAGLRPRNGELDRQYLWRCLEHVRPELEKRGRGSTFLQVSRRDIAELEIPLPADVSEQRRIAAILDRAAAIRRKREGALALADDFLRSLFLEMFGDPIVNPKGLPKQPLGRFGKIVTGNTPPRSDPDNFGDAIEWIKSDNVNTEEHFLTRPVEGLSIKGKALGRTVPKGSILVTCIAGSPSSIGRAAIADRAVAFNQQINAITPNRDVNLYFLYAQFLVGKPLVLRSSTNSMKGMISKGEFQKIRFLYPEPKEQEKFGKIFEKQIKTREQLQEAANCAADFFGTLSHRAFRGEL